MPFRDAQLQGSYDMDMSSVAALTFLVWDILITLDQEVDAVWSKPNKFYSKWLFLFVRYFAVVMQIALLFTGTQLALNFHYTESDCIKWYIFQEVGTQLLIAAVEFILLIRRMLIPPSFIHPSPNYSYISLEVHALYDRNRNLTATLFFLFFVENIAMIVTLIKVVSGVRFDATCTVIHSPPTLLIFAVAFVAFETLLFILTLFKFIVALRNGWGRTPVVYLLVRDGTWAFVLIFVSLLLKTPATLCVNAGFYLGEGNSSNAAIAFPWLLSIEAFAGARIVLNLHTLAFDVSADKHGTLDNDGTLSSHIIFTTHPSAANHARTSTVRWDWGGLGGYSYDDRSGHASGSGSRSGGTGTGTVSESYEMTWVANGTGSDRSGTGIHKHCRGASLSASNYTSPTTRSAIYLEGEAI
ncbi:hypothetical protein B0F90DRAFT_1919443 [Multifurca ochricompacta]|uniref:DUF6533 domain-containing protein n=1 Tax=Multifurca ochricompacta TaxID=376703 RepID=A0AAD4QI41_9AGAM|nr:hypothetical protein B0F90DRAFT_1919443 [Multifurca ochricompacta]